MASLAQTEYTLSVLVTLHPETSDDFSQWFHLNNKKENIKPCGFLHWNSSAFSPGPLTGTIHSGVSRSILEQC